MEIRQTFTSLAMRTPIENNRLAKMKETLIQRFGPAIYRDWLQQLTMDSVTEGVMDCSVPSIFVKDWISQH